MEQILKALRFILTTVPQKTGGAKGIRTLDLLRDRQAL